MRKWPGKESVFFIRDHHGETEVVADSLPPLVDGEKELARVSWWPKDGAWHFTWPEFSTSTNQVEQLWQARGFGTRKEAREHVLALVEASAAKGPS